MRKGITTLITVMLFVLVTGVESYAEFDITSILDIPQCLLAKYTCSPFACKIKTKGIPLPGDLVCHYVPVGFVETTTGAFTTAVPLVGQVLSALASQASAQQSGGAEQKGDTYLHYFETHVFNVPTFWFLKLKAPFLRLCSYSEGFTWVVHYLSEIDAISWRTGITDIAAIRTFIGGTIAQLTQICPLSSVASSVAGAGINPLGDVCMGTWGVTYPRTGFSNAESEPVASASAAYRASRVVAKPWLRVVLVPKMFKANVKMQLGFPKFGKPLNCFDRGLTPAAWDNFTVKPPKGTGYIWVLWDRKCCCKRPPGCILPVGI